MRWLFLIVLSLNLAYIAWQTAMPDEGAYAHVQPLKNVQPIVLLSELKPSSIQLDEVVENAPREEQGKDNVEDPVEVEEVAELKKVDPVPLEVAKPEPMKPELINPEPVKPVAIETQPVKTEKTIVAESKEAELEHKKAVSSPTPISSLAGTSCYTLGPFRDLDKLRNFTREIKPYVVETDFRGREEKEQSLYWVYIPPEKNRKQAIEMGKRLKDKKVKDFYVIREGEKIHGISLGHFRNKEGAQGLVKKIRKLGFNVLLEPVFRTYTVYWMDYRLASGVNIPELILEKYTKSTQKDKISRLNRDCAA